MPSPACRVASSASSRSSRSRPALHVHLCKWAAAPGTEVGGDRRPAKRRPAHAGPPPAPTSRRRRGRPSDTEACARRAAGVMTAACGAAPAARAARHPPLSPVSEGGRVIDGDLRASRVGVALHLSLPSHLATSSSPPVNSRLAPRLKAPPSTAAPPATARRYSRARPCSARGARPAVRAEGRRFRPVPPDAPPAPRRGRHRRRRRRRPPRRRLVGRRRRTEHVSCARRRPNSHVFHGWPQQPSSTSPSST